MENQRRTQRSLERRSLRGPALFRAILTLAALAAVAVGATPTLPRGTEQNLFADANPSWRGSRVPDAVRDQFAPCDEQSDLFHGVLGERMRVNLERRLLTLDLDSILRPYTQRPGAQSWAGEHVGKFLHAATLVWRQTGDERLRKRIDYAAAQLIGSQMADGYLGTYLEKDRWTSWDVWSHKYNLIGLLSCYEANGDLRALDACRKVGDLLVATFGEGKRDIIKSGTHVGMAPTSVLEPMVMLYRYTFDRRYLDFCLYLVKAWEQEHGPKLVSSLTKHGNVFKTANGKAYEMMSCLVGLLELYRVTGRPEFLQACTNAWEDIRRNQNYPTGSSSWAEHFRAPGDLVSDGAMHGEKYVAAAEGCVTVTWIQLNWHLLRLTGEAVYAAELERSVYNALAAAQSPRDGTVCYFLPMIGRKRYAEVNHGIGPDISCCASSVPRGLAMLPACSAGSLHGGPALALFQPGTYRIHGGGQSLGFSVEGDFPVQGNVTVRLQLSQPLEFPFSLRVPAWCPVFVAEVAGQTYRGRAGEWLRLQRRWAQGDTIRITLALPVFTETLPVKEANLVAILRGPQVLAADAALAPGTPLPKDWIGRQSYTQPLLGREGETKALLVPVADAGQLGADYHAVFSNVLLDTSEDGRAVQQYRAALDAFRAEFGGSSRLPAVEFFQFGMGKRPKLLFRDGALLDGVSGTVVRKWNVHQATLVPPEYRVAFTTAEGLRVRIVEDEAGVWIEEDGIRQLLPGSASPVRLPRFEGHRHAAVLRVLHHEVLINVVDGLPVPNFQVYRKPWHRDSAMMAMVLKETGNLDVVRDWILGLTDPYDRNNNGDLEPDCLGQVLYLLSLVSDRNHPLVAKILAEIPRFEVTDSHGTYINGSTDFSPHPVYQTKWLKFGLRALGLPDDRYRIPAVPDSYSALFWMDYRDQHVPGQKEMARGGNYPYLGWAVDHFEGVKRSPISNRDYPLTWEIQASSAVYPGMALVSPILAKERTSVPHTWHAAEVFLHTLRSPQ